tara:strand:+ start:2124 stop:4625 length:2502 start_codon:yes stop_codon:yes gene_type:complete
MRQRANARSEEHSRVFSAAVLRCSVVAPVPRAKKSGPSRLFGCVSRPLKQWKLALFLSASALALPLAIGLAPDLLNAYAASDTTRSSDALVERIRTNPDAQMLVEADALIYNYDTETVTAQGNVEIVYDGYTLNADRVVYEQRSGKMMAIGNVRITEPTGNVLTADQVDITEDFRDGFVKSLQVRTPENATFGAESAERTGGNRTVFNQGSYTACKACEKRPTRPYLWQIKASKVIHDQKEQMIYYENAWLEFFGVPVAYLPYFSHADPSVKRKSGFLMPRLSYGSAIGVGLTTPYFFNLAPNYDLTISPTFYSGQGVLLDAEWRHKLITGSYRIRAAGIAQFAPDQFAGLQGDETLRGYVQSDGEFNINQQWKWGWDVTAISDRTFTRDYDLEDTERQEAVSTLYLTGQSERNFFELRGYQFRALREDQEDSIGTDFQEEQALVHPVLDYNLVFGDPVLNGELSFDLNFTSLSRENTDFGTSNGDPTGRVVGPKGTYTRLSLEATWQKTLVGPMGQLFTPFASLRGDAFWLEQNEPLAPFIEDNEAFRGLALAGIEWRWPLIAQHTWGTQRFEPVAQVILRSNENLLGSLPNEDAQSLVFDDTNLFSVNKFSGYDRVEGGSRVNIGMIYRADLNNGISIRTVLGQSLHLFGTNSFANPDVAATGLDSGLETDRSDYIARFTLDTANDLRLDAFVRLDESNFAVNRSEITASGKRGFLTASLGYAYFAEQPNLGIANEREEIRGSASLQVNENWRVFGDFRYDIENNGAVSDSIGIAYDDECFGLSLSYTETHDRYTDLETDQRIYLRVNLKTIGGGKVSQDLGGGESESVSY